MTSMEPIPETVEAVNSLMTYTDDGHLLGNLTRLANQGREIVPDLVGVSIGQLAQNLTFTLVASDVEFAVLDAVQYLAGGPCVVAAHAEEVVEFEHDALDEDRWQLFAEATAARAVRSTLTLPVMNDKQVVGTVNLYAASGRAFVGHHEELAAVFGAWASGAVANADLSFSTRDEAAAAPQRLEDQFVIEIATGIVAVQLTVDGGAAKAHMQGAASRAGVSVLQLARDIVDARQWDGGERGS